MKTICLVKQIPRPDRIEFDQETKSLKREGVPLILNPFDARAVAEAVRLREAVGGEVVAMAMGPPRAEEALRKCLALGADRCIHLSDRAFALADTIGTSRTLALAIGKEGCDLVLCGLKTLDAETWQVPPEVAAFLDRPHVTNSVGLAVTACACGVRRTTARNRSRSRFRPSSLLRGPSVSRTTWNPQRAELTSGPRRTSSATSGSTTSASGRPARRRVSSPSTT
jgi:electron transfer flavoprotein alpha/beta subunit